MAHIDADRVKETTTTIGTGAITLAGAVVGFRSFSSAMSIGDTCSYAVVSATGLEWETGIGTYSGATTLTRTTIKSSANNTSPPTAMVFTAGVKDVFIGPIAGTLIPYNPVTGALNLSIDSLSDVAIAGASKNEVIKFDGSNWTNQPDSVNVGTVTSVAVSGGTTGLTVSGSPITGAGTITVAGTLAVANGGTGVTTSTGTTNVVLSNSPTLVTPFSNALSAVPVVSGTGNSLTISAGSGVGTGPSQPGGSLILQAGVQAVGGGDGKVIVRQVAGQTGNLQEWQTSASGGTLKTFINNAGLAYLPSGSLFYNQLTLASNGLYKGILVEDMAADGRIKLRHSDSGSAIEFWHGNTAIQLNGCAGTNMYLAGLTRIGTAGDAGGSQATLTYSDGLTPQGRSYFYGRTYSSSTNHPIANYAYNGYEFNTAVNASWNGGQTGAAYGSLSFGAIGHAWYFAAALSTVKPLVIKGAASQTANLQEWQNSAGTALAYVDAAGKTFANSLSSVPVTSGAGNSLTLAAGSGVGAFKGGDIILQPGAQGSSGGNGVAELRNGTIAQSLHVYNTYTDNLNYERLVISWNYAANTGYIGMQRAGTGAQRNCIIDLGGNPTAGANRIQTNGTNAVEIWSGNQVYLRMLSGAFSFYVGYVGFGATLPLNFGVSAPGNVNVTADKYVFRAIGWGTGNTPTTYIGFGAAYVPTGAASTTAHVQEDCFLVRLLASQTPIVAFGSSFVSTVPAIKRVGTQLQVRLADDSADASFSASYIKTPALTVATLPAAATAGAGSRAFVSDATLTTFATVPIGGGANGVPVYSDGTNWRIG